MFLGGIILLLKNTYTFYHVPLLLFCLCVCNLGYGFISPQLNAFTLDKIEFPAYAAAGLGFFQLAISAFANLIFSHYFDNKLLLIALVWIFSACILFLLGQNGIKYAHTSENI